MARRNSFQIVLICLVILCAIPTTGRTQDKFVILLEEYEPLIQHRDIATDNFLQAYSDLDLSEIWLSKGRNGYLGFVGPNYQRLRIKLDTVDKDRDKSTVYNVSGRAALNGKVKSFSGTLNLAKIVELTAKRLGVDDEKPLNGIRSQGIVLGEYAFRHNGPGASTELFKGVFSARFYLNEKGQVRYDDIEREADSFRNNQFIGSWTSSSTDDTVVANFGDFRIPASGDLDIGACCFSPDEKYKRYGWQDYKVDGPDDFDWGNPR